MAIRFETRSLPLQPRSPLAWVATVVVVAIVVSLAIFFLTFLLIGVGVLIIVAPLIRWWRRRRPRRARPRVIDAEFTVAPPGEGEGSSGARP
jgi:hypothetical protein